MNKVIIGLVILFSLGDMACSPDNKENNGEVEIMLNELETSNRELRKEIQARILFGIEDSLVLKNQIPFYDTINKQLDKLKTLRTGTYDQKSLTYSKLQAYVEQADRIILEDIADGNSHRLKGLEIVSDNKFTSEIGWFYLLQKEREVLSFLQLKMNESIKYNLKKRLGEEAN